MEVSVKTIVYVVLDSHGNYDFDCATESGSVVRFNGLKNKKNEFISFECECYHLEKWCAENDCRMVVKPVLTKVAI